MAIDPSPTKSGPRSTDKSPSPLASPNLAAQEDRRARVRDVPRSNFQYGHRRQEWQVGADGDLMPVIVPLSKSPGAQGVGRRGEFTPARVWYEDQGMVLIPHDVMGDLDYVAPYLTTRGKMTHRSIFQRPVNGANKTDWVMDGKAYKKFIKLCREKGIIPPPQPQTIKSLLNMTRSQYENLQVPTTEDRSRRDRYEATASRLKKQISVLEAELHLSEEHYGKPTEAVLGSDVHSVLDAALDTKKSKGKGKKSASD